MKRLWLWIVMGVWASFMAARGANVIREARKTIKEARYEENGDAAKKVAERLNAAEKSLLEAIPAEKKLQKKAALYFTAASVQCRFNDIENEKIYLKRAYDTTLYYNSIYKVYQYLRQCDSVESSAGHDAKHKFRQAARKRMLAYRTNLLNGGRFYLRKKNYAEACRFLDLYLSSRPCATRRKLSATPGTPNTSRNISAGPIWHSMTQRPGCARWPKAS